MTPDDAWPLLKAKLLYIFEGEDPRPPIEDFNALVSVHIRRCIQRRAPNILIEDLGELLQTGFASLDQTLKHVPDERLVPHLVEMWAVVLGTILHFLQAIFLPLDMEFKGTGPLLTKQAAKEFWGASSNSDSDTETLKDNNTTKGLIPTMGEDLDVRRFILITFRDTVILPRYDALTSIFSQLSLESLNKGIADTLPEPQIPQRPGTATSLDPGVASYNSTSSTLLDSAGSVSAGARSRATSNTSAGSFGSLGVGSPAHHAPLTTTHSNNSVPSQHSSGQDRHSRVSHFQPVNTLRSMISPTPIAPVSSSQVTQTVGRMLQCVQILAGVQTADEGQREMDNLCKLLKHNWLGRGRTGGRRQGIVGGKTAGRTGIVVS
ncbi:hypothetical protein LTS18_013821 [Coniosporium uncinatum]|uniref:Uncharacterized protein n=1 Tax=Coniosporium uncinatum TaxID=93489 RepID=A0ACC3DHR4_9PEZI|nr:hypothetical protein LTS18_013821 [Coniosporium uncinatum]